MRRAPIWRPLLALFGAVESNSYVELSSDALRLRFGLFDETVPLSEIEGARARSWPWIFGIGWRTNFATGLGLIGSYKGVVDIRLRSKRRMRFLLPFIHVSPDRVAVSLEDPDGFLTALQEARSKA